MQLQSLFTKHNAGETANVEYISMGTVALLPTPIYYDFMLKLKMLTNTHIFSLTIKKPTFKI